MAVPDEVAVFGGGVVEPLRSVLGEKLVGVWFVGSIALRGSVPGESDIDIAAVCAGQLPDTTRRAIASIDVPDSRRRPASSNCAGTGSRRDCPGKWAASPKVRLRAGVVKHALRNQ